jgi:hypothetical protein
VRQRAIGGWLRFSPTGTLFQRDAATKQHGGAGTHDANEGSRCEGVSVVDSPAVMILPSVAHTLYPSDAADRDEVAKGAYGFMLSDAAKAIESVEPAWRV